MVRTLLMVGIAIGTLAIFPGCENDPVSDKTPVAFAGNDTIVPPESTIVLMGSGSHANSGEIVSWEWQFNGSDTFVPVSTGDTTVLSPFDFGDNYQYVLRVTDTDGRVATDTLTVVVSWFYSPHGGEVFVVGDSLRVYLFPLAEQMDIRLQIERGGDQFELRPPGASGAFIPLVEPYKAYHLPDSIYDLGNMISTVSDSCKVKVFRYNTTVSCRSKGYISIRPQN